MSGEELEGESRLVRGDELSRGIDAFGLTCGVAALVGLATGSSSPLLVAAPALAGGVTFATRRFDDG